MTYKTEFPNFPDADMPAIPPGFVDGSWHNDACPSFHNEARGLQIYVDYADPAKREVEGMTRYTVLQIDSNSVPTDLLNTDNWDEVLAIIDDKACRHRDDGRGFCIDCGRAIA